MKMVFLKKLYRMVTEEELQIIPKDAKANTLENIIKKNENVYFIYLI